jgi:hypothetical protein
MMAEAGTIFRFLKSAEMSGDGGILCSTYKQFFDGETILILSAASAACGTRSHGSNAPALLWLVSGGEIISTGKASESLS